jgi:signal transduction histidine kinase
LIRDALPADHSTRPMVEQILSAGERAAFLARQLLALGSQATQEHKVVDITAVINEIHELIGRLIGKQIELSFESDPESCQVKADPRQLQQIAMNLILNARDAMPEGGRLRIVTTNVELRRDDVKPDSDIRHGRFVRVSVCDTGCGMSTSVQARIFEPFFTTKQHGKGTGLGLSVVESIVKQHGGFIEFESVPGQGTQFHVVLPAANERDER